MLDAAFNNVHDQAAGRQFSDLFDALVSDSRSAFERYCHEYVDRLFRDRHLFRDRFVRSHTNGDWAELFHAHAVLRIGSESRSRKAGMGCVLEYLPAIDRQLSLKEIFCFVQQEQVVRGDRAGIFVVDCQDGRLGPYKAERLYPKDANERFPRLKWTANDRL